jgi:iron complex outermembrane receptor protein
MKRINVEVARAVGRILATSAVMASASTIVHAQNQTDEIATVVVTGSHIANQEQGALPIQVITQAQIEQTGATSAEQFLKTVSVAVQGNSNVVAASTAGANVGGVSGVSLRGLGSQRTLVLVNGRRLSGGGTITDSVTVDVNSIPLAAIDHVEVYKNGGSAVYGSDAIAGVINFVIKDSYQGATATLFGGGTKDGGGGIKRANGALGYGDLTADRYNLMLTASYQKEDPLFGRDRGFSSSSVNVPWQNDTTSGNSFPANIFVPVGPALPGADGTPGNPLYPNNCAPSVNSPLRPGTCRYDPAGEVSLLPDAERVSAFGAAHFFITDDAQLYAEASFSRNRQRFTLQATPISDQFNLPPGHPLSNLAPYNRGAGLGGPPSPFAFTTVVLKPSSQFYPTAAVQAITGDGSTPDILIRYRSNENGNRDFTDTAEQPRGVLGIKGTLAGWDYDAAYLYGQTKLTEHYNNGAPLYSKLLPLLNSGRVNFFGPNTPDVLAELRATNFVGDAYSTKTSIQSLGGSASREIAKLPAGSLAIALGAEWRKEKFSTDPSPEMQIGDIATYGGDQHPLDKSRNAKALLAELDVPIIENMDGNIAVRWDDYDTVGSKTTPEVRWRWRPVEQLMLRASFGKGFRAPSLTELYQPVVTGVSAAGLDDPARCPQTQDSNDCGTQFNVQLGGTPTLKPETSTNYTLGVVFEPTGGTSIGFDAFKVKLKNPIIFGIDPSALLDDEARFGSFITRGAPTTNCPGCPGPVLSIDQRNLNLGETNVDGVDADLRYRLSMERMGTLTFGLVGTYFTKYEIQQTDGSFLSVVSTVSPIVNGAGGVIPRWHHYLSLGWNIGPWEAVVAQNFQTKYTDLTGNIAGAPEHEVGSYQTFDLQASYSGIQNLKIAVGLKNAFDRDPPYTNVGGSNYFQAGYDPGYADPRGRFIYGTLSYSFQ